MEMYCKNDKKQLELRTIFSEFRGSGSNIAQFQRIRKLLIHYNVIKIKLKNGKSKCVILTKKGKQLCKLFNELSKVLGIDFAYLFDHLRKQGFLFILKTIYNQPNKSINLSTLSNCLISNHISRNSYALRKDDFFKLNLINSRKLRNDTFITLTEKGIKLQIIVNTIQNVLKNN